MAPSAFVPAVNEGTDTYKGRQSSDNLITNEPRRERTSLGGFRQGATVTEQSQKQASGLKFGV